MKHSIYVRPSLPATRRGLADPKPLVESLIRRLKELLKTVEETPAREDARALYILHLKMQRVRPELIRRVEDGQEVMEEVSRIVKRTPGRYAKMAMESMDLQKWKKEAGKLFELSESLGDPQVEPRLGEEILEYLDETDLVLHGASEAGCESGDLATELADCNEWLARNSDLFLSCGVKVQRTALSFREELPRAHPSLAWTGRKYVEILDELEVARKELRWEGLEPFDPSDVKALFNR